MLSRINVSCVVADHLATLRNYNEQNTSTADLILFFATPAVVSLVMLLAGLPMSKSVVTVLFAGVAIFAGLLLNLLMLVHGVVRSTAKSPRFREEKKLLQEVYANISYSILVTILMLAFLLMRYIPGNNIWLYSLSAVTYFLVANFLLTLLMILKRIHIVLGKEFDLDDPRQITSNNEN